MLRSSRIGVVASAAALLAAALAGCGSGAAGSTPPATVPTAKEVLRCVFAGGGHPGDQVPLKPKGFPAHVETAMIDGPDYDHVGFFISRKPVFTEQIAHGFEQLGEFNARILLGGRAVMLYRRHYLSKKTEHLALSCLER